MTTPTAPNKTKPNAIARLYHGIAHILGRFLPKNKEEVLNLIVPFAESAFNVVATTNWDAPGARSQVIGRIEQVALTTGADWAKKEFLDPDGSLKDDILAGSPVSDIKRWLGVAETTLALVNAGHPLPHYGDIHTALQGVWTLAG